MTQNANSQGIEMMAWEMMPGSVRRLGNNEQGVVLFMSLVMLLILTILGISSVQTTSLQERMSRNSRDSDIAFQSAESALRDGEDVVQSLNSLLKFTQGQQGYYYDNGPNINPNWKEDNDPATTNVTWSAASGAAGNYIQAGTTVVGVAEQPKYIIEHVKTVVSDADVLNLDNIGQGTGSGRTQIFRITAYSTGGSDTAHVMIQGTYGERF